MCQKNQSFVKNMIRFATKLYVKKAYTSEIKLSGTILDQCLIFMVKVILEKLIV